MAMCAEDDKEAEDTPWAVVAAAAGGHHPMVLAGWLKRGELMLLEPGVLTLLS